MTQQTIDIQVKHVTRVEGHGNIVVQASDGRILKNEWQVPEAPRYFEAMVKGQHYQDIQTIVSRICGICSVTHSLAAIKAIEDAMQVQISPQTETLRILTHYGEQIESHSLHVGYLVAPDLLGAKSVVPLVSSHPDVVKNIIMIHRAGNTIMERLAGRKTHPVRVQPGGFTMLPTDEELRELATLFEDVLTRCTPLVEVLCSLVDKIPDFDRPTEHVALIDVPKYPFYGGEIGTTDSNELVPVQSFEQVVNEYVTTQSTAKWARWHREAYAVGALSRFKINHEHLVPEAKAAAKTLGLTPLCENPYFNTIAQVVEIAQVAVRGRQLLEELLTDGIKPETIRITPRAGDGAGAVEAPRGTLFHRYQFDAKGICIGANMSIPSNQNHGNIQQDFEALVPSIIDREQDEIRLMMEMLVRAYDPCISCSTHFLDIEFV